MAAWGSGGTTPYYKAVNQMELQQVLAQLVDGVALDPCCPAFECQVWPPMACWCGNGVVEACGDDPPVQEECDDGNDLPGDGCSPECTLEMAGTSTGGTSTGNTGTSGGSTDWTTTGDGTTTGGSSSGGSSGGTGSSSSSGGEVVTTGEGSTGSGGVVSTGEGSSTGEAPGAGQDGCGCAADGSGARGVWAGLLALGLGLGRRRRGRGLARRGRRRVRRGVRVGPEVGQDAAEGRLSAAKLACAGQAASW